MNHLENREDNSRNTGKYLLEMGICLMEMGICLIEMGIYLLEMVAAP